MTFWDTVRGTRLADTLIRELPKLTKKKNQEYYCVEDVEKVRELVESGKQIISAFTAPDGRIVVITEE